MPWDRRNKPKAQKGHRIPEAQRQRVIKRDRSRGCYFAFSGICTGVRGKLQIHHLVEYEDGGTDEDENLTLTCAPCHVHYSAQEWQKRATAAANDWKRGKEKHPGILD